MNTYMYVYERIWWHLHVYVCICSYIRICMYFLEWHPETLELMPRPRKTLSVGGNRRATLRAPQGIWASTFFCHLQTWCKGYADPIWRTPPRGTRPGPLKHPSRFARRSPMHDPLTIIQSHGVPQQIWSVGDHPGARRRRLHPLENTSWPRFADVCICMYSRYMYVYACICMYMYVYVCIYGV